MNVIGVFSCEPLCNSSNVIMELSPFLCVILLPVCPKQSSDQQVVVKAKAHRNLETKLIRCNISEISRRDSLEAEDLTETNIVNPSFPDIWISGLNYNLTKPNNLIEPLKRLQ